MREKVSQPVWVLSGTSELGIKYTGYPFSAPLFYYIFMFMMCKQIGPLQTRLKDVHLQVI